MLLAVLDAGDSRARERAIDTVSTVWGPSQANLRLRGGWLGAWKGPAGLQVDTDAWWIAEGWLDLASPDLSAGTLREARGDFALLALRDEGVLLATGRAGGYRPIFVARPSPELVVACTRLSVLLTLLPHKPPLDLEYVASAALGYRPRSVDCTPYARIKRLPLGEAWVVRPGAEVNRWSTRKPLVEPELRDDDQLPCRLRDAVTRATRGATRGAARVGVEVSGGLDSSFLLSLLVSFARGSDAVPGKPQAIAYECVAPAWHDDRPHLRSLEAQLGIDVCRVHPSDGAPFIGGSLVVDAMPAPSATLFASSVVGRVARESGVDVVLTGVGGDDVLDGSPRLFADLARKGRIRAALDGALRTRGVFYHGRFGRLDRFFLRPLVASMLPRSAWLARQRLRARLPPWAGSRPRSGMNLHTQAGDAPISLKDSPDQRYSRLLGMDLLAYLPLLHLQEEVVGGYALRAPLLDDEFLRFVATVPPLSLMRGGYLRGLMREAMRGLVPEDLRLRVTKGHPYWFVEQTVDEAGGLQLFADLADVRMLADLRMVEPRPFRKLFDACAGRTDDADYFALWHVLSAESFLREYAGDGATRAT
jgi:asparagine synthase (glutamine-hydrolysing)